MIAPFISEFHPAATAPSFLRASRRERAAITFSLAASVLPRRFAVGLALTLSLGAVILLSSIILRQQSAQDRPEVLQTPQQMVPVVPHHQTPSVEPLVFAKVDRQTARDLNAAMPYANLGTDSPLPFRMKPGSHDFARALDCLASAALYEAGDDPVGQAAVVQVVLNRVAHPAFPNSVCAVVYQGSQRTTGCQFTFTCDGALSRTPSAAAWDRARAVATAFLNGKTYPAVGMATHYHTDWVYPYWSNTLDKVAHVGTHLFFRWRGMWGRRSAFTSPYAGVEPQERKLSFLSEAHHEFGALKSAANANSIDTAPNVIQPGLSGVLREHTGDHFILVDGGGDGTELALKGLAKCGGEPYCKVIGWDRRSQDYGSPQNPVIQTVAFLYVSDKRTGVEMVLWDCARFNRPSDSQCLSDRNRRWIGFQGDLSRAL